MNSIGPSRPDSGIERTSTEGAKETGRLPPESTSGKSDKVGKSALGVVEGTASKIAGTVKRFAISVAGGLGNSLVNFSKACVSAFKPSQPSAELQQLFKMKDHLQANAQGALKRAMSKSGDVTAKISRDTALENMKDLAEGIKDPKERDKAVKFIQAEIKKINKSIEEYQAYNPSSTFSKKLEDIRVEDYNAPTS